MKRLLLTVMLCIGMVMAAFGQRSLYTIRVVADSFPRMRAEVLRIDGTTTVSIEQAETHVIEDRIDRGVLSVECPPPGPPLDLSSVLTVDISGSMAKGAPNITLARAAAQAWIEALLPGSECAVTSFDNRHYLNIDFTDDKVRLLDVLPSLQPRGGTDYNQGFLGEPYGGLRVAAEGRKKRVMVFLTDGFGGGSAPSFIRAAREHDITVYCVSLGMRMPDALKQVSDSTGGLWFENVTTVQDAIMAYRRIFAAATSRGTCSVSWMSDVACGPDRIGRIVVGSDTATVAYTVPSSKIARLRITPSSTSFGVILPGIRSERDVTLTAENADISIGSVKTFGHAGFELVDAVFPFTIRAGTSQTVKIRFSSTDTSYAAARFMLETAPCSGPTIFVSAGSMFRPPTAPTIKVIHPNGGERFFIGTTTHLTYEGVALDEPVRLDISTDNGQTWRTALQNATGLDVQWRVFNAPSERCLLRVTQEQPSPKDMSTQVLARLDGEKIRSVAFSKSGTRIITAGWEKKSAERSYYGQVRIWNARSGVLERQFDGGFDAFILPDDRTVISWGEGMVFAWDLVTGNQRWRSPLIPTNAPHDIQASEDGSRLFIAGGWGDSTLLVETSTGRVVQRFPRADKDIRWASMSADAQTIAICDADSSVHVYDADSATKKFSIRESGSKIYYACAISPTGDVLAVSTGNGTTSLWDVATGSKLRDMARRQYVNDNTYITFSPDGSRVVLESGRDRTQIFDVNSGEAVVTIKRTDLNSPVTGATFSGDGSLVALQSFFRTTIYNAQTGVRIAEYRRNDGLPAIAPDGSRIAIATEDSHVDVFRLQPDVLQQDVSDAVWAIERERPRLRDLRFAPRFVHTGKDSVVQHGLVNRSASPVTIKNLRIEGSQGADFGVLTSAGFTIAAHDSIDIEYAFHPRTIGELAALVIAETDLGLRLTARITGRSIPPIIAADAQNIDMGEVQVGTMRTATLSKFIVNTGKVPMTVTDIRITGSNDSSFTITPIDSLTLPPGDSVAVYATFSPTSPGRTSGIVEVRIKGLREPLTATIMGNGLTRKAYGQDPTTFRGVALPTAIVPPAGTITTAVYDIIGVSVGASITDNIMIVTGASVPIPSRWFGAEGLKASVSYAYSAGVKAGLSIADNMVAGLGYQWGQSIYDQEFSEGIIDSRITFNTLWATYGIGDDDSRLNAWVGYAFKRHVTGFEGRFNADATILAMNYDRRIARHWKITGEIFFMRTMPIIPITIAARYFGDTYALEAGFTFTGIPSGGAGAPSIPIVPMVSWVATW